MTHPHPPLYLPCSFFSLWLLFLDRPPQPSVTPPTSAIFLAALPSPSPSIPVALPTAVMASSPSPRPIPVGMLPTIVSPPSPPLPPVPTSVSQPLATTVPIISVVSAPPDTPMEAPPKVLVMLATTNGCRDSISVFVKIDCCRKYIWVVKNLIVFSFQLIILLLKLSRYLLLQSNWGILIDSQLKNLKSVPMQ